VTGAGPSPTFTRGKAITADALNAVARNADVGVGVAAPRGGGAPANAREPGLARLVAVVGRAVGSPAPLHQHAYTVLLGDAEIDLAWEQLIVEAGRGVVGPSADPALLFAPAELASAVEPSGPKWRGHGLLYTLPGTTPGETVFAAELWGLTQHHGCGA
jgi:hypothetical protein